VAKIYLKQLQKKYNFNEGDVTGLNYRKLMQDIISNQSENISKATSRISKQNYDKQIKEFMKRLGERGPEKRITLPDVSEALPKRSVFLRKGAQDGNILTDTLRDNLTRNLRESLGEFKTKTGEQAFVRRKGTKAGSINTKVIDVFEEKIKGTFENYTKSDPRFGVPANVHQIAVTEIRSTVDAIKHNYNIKLAKKNRDNVEMYKIWRQNKSLAKEPRVSHDKVNGIRLPIDEAFQVPIMVKKGGQMITIGTDSMQHPHDPNASAENVIGCNCDIEYIMIWKLQT